MLRRSVKVLLLMGLLGLTSSGCRDTDKPPSAAPTEQTPVPSAAPSSSAETPAEPIGADQLRPSNDACQVDADCVPDTCCHAAACVARSRAPDCSGAMCTLDCRGGTMDCSGKCVCHEGHCAAWIRAL